MHQMETIFLFYISVRKHKNKNKNEGENTIRKIFALYGFEFYTEFFVEYYGYTPTSSILVENEFNSCFQNIIHE